MKQIKVLEEKDDLKGASILHVADLLNTASSYVEKWVPTIKKHNGSIKHSMVIFDRAEGGDDVLANEGIKSHALITNSFNLFLIGYRGGYINKEQFELVLHYLSSPESTMKKFLQENPGFVEEALNCKDPKIAERALSLIRKNHYDIQNMYPDSPTIKKSLY